MTDEVAALVLRNNYLQTLALSLAERRGLEDLGFQQRLMQTLEARGELDRAVEFLPDDMEIAERVRRSQPLTRPELSVLLAYAKLSLQRELLESAVPDDPYLARELDRYFPPALAQNFPDALEQHRLRREIIATQLANSMINRGGPSLVVRIADQTGAAAARHRGGLRRGARQLRHAGAQRRDRRARRQGAGKLQLALYAAVQNLLLDRLVWFLRNADLSQGPRRRWSSTTAPASPRWRPRSTSALPAEAAAARAARADGTRQGRRAGGAGAADRRPARAHRRARHRAGRRAHRQADRCRSRRPTLRAEAFFRLDRDRRRRRAASRSPIISTGWRSTARSMRSATPSAASPRRWSRPASRARPRSRPGSRRARPRSSASAPSMHADRRAAGLTLSQAHGGGEPARRSRGGVTFVLRRDVQPNAGNAACR